MATGMLNGGTATLAAQVAGVSGAGKTAKLVGCKVTALSTSGSSVSVGDYGNGVLSVIDGGSFSAGSNALTWGHRVPARTGVRSSSAAAAIWTPARV